MSTNRETLRALMDASKRKDHEAFLALWVDDNLAYHWSMHAKPVTTKEKLQKFLRNYSGRFEQREWTITHCIEQGDLMLCEGIEVLYDREQQREIRNPFMQAIEFRGGKVAAMRDYYDSAAMAPPAAVPGAARQA